MAAVACLRLSAVAIGPAGGSNRNPLREKAPQVQWCMEAMFWHAQAVLTVCSGHAHVVLGNRFV